MMKGFSTRKMGRFIPITAHAVTARLIAYAWWNERMYTVERECEGNDCEGCADCPTRLFVAEGEPQVFKDMWLHRLAEAQIWRNVGPDWHDEYPDIVEDVYNNWLVANTPQPIPPMPAPSFMEMLSRAPRSPKLALLACATGETVLYLGWPASNSKRMGMLNTVFGLPGKGKSWLGTIAAIAAVDLGARVFYLDFESTKDGIAERSGSARRTAAIGKPQHAIQTR